MRPTQRFDGVETPSTLTVERLAHDGEVVERGIVLVDRHAGIGDQQLDRMGIVEARASRPALADRHVDRAAHRRCALGAARLGDRLQPHAIAPGQRQRHAGCA
jgi:hypothetical protein